MNNKEMTKLIKVARELGEAISRCRRQLSPFCSKSYKARHQRGISSALQTMMGANMEATLLATHVAAQANGYQFKLMNIPDSVQLGPDSFDFDPEIMKVLFEKGLKLGRNPSSWVAAPAPGQSASPCLINLLAERRRER